MDYVNCESAKEMDRIGLFEKKLSFFKQVAIFSIISFKIRSFWYCEMMQFSGVFGLELVVWAMGTVNMQKKWAEYLYLENCF